MSAQLSPTPVFKGFANDGTPLAYGLLYSYAAGTTTPQATYTDSTKTTQNTNPITLNARGECALWLDPTLSYKLNLTDLQGNQISGYPVDNIFIGIPLPLDSVNVHYDITAAETNVSVTPVNYNFPGPGQGPSVSAYRYGFVGNGTADDTIPLQTLFTVCQQGYNAVIPHSQPKITSGLTWNGSGSLLHEGADGYSYLAPSGAGYTAFTAGSSSPCIFNDFALVVHGTANAVGGIVLGTSSTVGNIQRSKISLARAYNLAGLGVQINDAYDSQFINVSGESCGTSSQWSVSVNNVTNTTNMCTFAHIQSEAATNKALKIDPIISCTFAEIHAERATGDGINPTHILGGNSVTYNASYLTATANGLLSISGANCDFTNILAPTLNVTIADGNNLSYQGNRINGLICNNLTISASNVNSWDFKSCAVIGTLTYDTQAAGKVRFENSTFANATAATTGGGCTAQFIDCQMTGTWTTTSGQANISGGTYANFPPLAVVTIRSAIVTAAYTTLAAQVILSEDCTYSGLITFQGNGMSWKGDGNQFAGGVALGTGSPGWLFGPRDRITGGSAGSGTNVSPQTAGSSTPYVLGEKTWNVAPTSTSVPYWICTSAGSPGTWTAAPIL